MHFDKKIKTILLIAISILAYGPAMAQKTYVVSVGIGDYKYPQIAPSLPCSVGDAKAMSNFFNHYNGSRVFMLLNENATRNHILTVLKREFAKSTPDDEVIFIFSGHGLQGGLTCYETQDAQSIITYDELQTIMKNVKARRKIILAMACYSGGLNLKRNNNKRTPHRKQRSSSVMLYTSSRPDEVSWERWGMPTSFFFNRVLQGLQGAADANRDKKVTARELFNYVNPRVINDTNGRQHPQMYGKFDDSMVLVYVK